MANRCGCSKEADLDTTTKVGGFSSADGDSELRRWRDSRTIPPLTVGANPLFDQFTPSPDSQDVAWLQDHSTRLR